MSVRTFAMSALVGASSLGGSDAHAIADFSDAADRAAEKMKLRGRDAPLPMREDVAETWQCPDQCDGDCGQYAGPCEGTGGGCAPYPFWPNRQNSGDQSWMYGPKFNQRAFVPYETEGENAYQAYQSPGAGDYWIVHGDDGAGVQTDCLGDVGYFEHFDDYQRDYGCKDGVSYLQAHWNQCSFKHPGKDYELWGKYQCGWWRGYNDAWDAALYNSWSDMGVSPPDDPKADWAPDALDSLRNCDNCPNGDATLHTFASANPPPEHYFTGSLSPWVCRYDGPNGDMWGFTNTAGKNCYCDNEPWKGRDGTNVPNWNTMFLYCGINDGDTGMFCDLIKFDQCHGSGLDKWCDGATIDAKGFWVDMAAF